MAHRHLDTLYFVVTAHASQGPSRALSGIGPAGGQVTRARDRVPMVQARALVQSRDYGFSAKLDALLEAGLRDRLLAIAIPVRVSRKEEQHEAAQTGCSATAASFFLITELYGNGISRMVEVGMLIILNCY